MRNGVGTRLTWTLGILMVWVLGWLVMGLRFLLIIGSSPHPFLPQLSYSGVMLRAVAEWGFHALTAHIGLGLLSSFLLFLWQRAGVQHSLEHHLSFRRGLLVGLGTFLWVHGLLYLDVPAALGMVQGIQYIPMGIVLMLLLGGGARVLAMAFGSTRKSAWRLAAGAFTIIVLVHLPHDLFRRMAPSNEPLPPGQRRLLVLGIDGLRQDIAEGALPGWKAPGGCQPVVAVPATRLAWNMLLGADPESFKYHLIIPFKDEYDSPPQPGLLDAAKARGISTIFLIDDSTTLSFLNTRTPFDQVYEPSGGWKHFFTVGAGTCWPVFSWAENYFSYIETTNPWCDDGSYFREVGRALERNQWVSAHTCEMHAPFYLRLDEIQQLRPWSWLLHPARAYQPYQGLDQAEKDQFRRQGGRSNPINHYRIRATRILKDLEPTLHEWELKFPNLSGVVTSDHGEEFVPVITPDGTLISYLTGIHGFDLTPDTLKVPLHPFGNAQAVLGPKDIYSWLDLRDDLGRWVQSVEPLRLTRRGPEGWLLSFPTVQAVHAMPKEIRDQGGIQGAGIKPEEFIRNTYLGFNGMWFMDTPPELETAKALSWALIQPDQTTTMNPIGSGKYLKSTYKDYLLTSPAVEISSESLDRVIKGFKAKHPGPWNAQN